MPNLGSMVEEKPIWRMMSFSSSRAKANLLLQRQRRRVDHGCFFFF